MKKMNWKVVDTIVYTVLGIGFIIPVCAMFVFLSHIFTMLGWFPDPVVIILTLLVEAVLIYTAYSIAVMYMGMINVVSQIFDKLLDDK